MSIYHLNRSYSTTAISETNDTLIGFHPNNYLPEVSAPRGHDVFIFRIYRSHISNFHNFVLGWWISLGFMLLAI